MMCKQCHLTEKEQSDFITWKIMHIYNLWVIFDNELWQFMNIRQCVIAV